MQEEEDCRKYRRCILSSKAALYDSITLLIRFQRTWLWSKQLCHHLSANAGDIVVVVVSILILSLYLRAFSKYLRLINHIHLVIFQKKIIHQDIIRNKSSTAVVGISS